MEVKGTLNNKKHRVQIRSSVSLGSYNVKGIIRNVLYLDSLLEKMDIDIMVISEHWLFNDNLCFLDAIHSKYTSHAASDCSLNPLDPYRRGKGGIGIMWKCCHSPLIHKIECESDRIIGISFQMDRLHSLTIIAVYLPDPNYGEELFCECLEKLQDLYHTYSQISEVIIMGDFNAHLPKDSSAHSTLKPRSTNLRNLLGNMNMISVNTSSKCTGPDYTYQGFKGGPTSMIDHICLNDTKTDLIETCCIIEDNGYNLSDHLPVYLKLNIVPLQVPEMEMHRCKYKWKSLTSEQKINGYGASLGLRLQQTGKPKFEEPSDVVNFHNILVNEMKTCSDHHVPNVKFKKHLKPYWKAENYILRQLHQIMRTKRITWLREGRPRGHEFISYVEYKYAKRDFRKKMRELAFKDEQQFYEEIEQASSIDQNNFWRLINSKRKKKGSCVYELKVNDKIYRHPVDILESWEEHFTNLYSETDASDQFDQTFKEEIEREFVNIVNESDNELDEIMHVPVEEEEMKTLIRKATTGKAAGVDSITNEHIKYGGSILCEYLTHLFNGIISVEKVPTEMKRGLLITIHKGSRKHLDDRRNHRGITLLNAIYKLFECLMLQRIQDWLLKKGIRFPSDQQGAYQKQLCCVMTSFNLQETVSYYNERHSTAYACLLDTSTAFDTVWHRGLFVKLHRLGIKGKTLRILMDCYSNMQTAVMYQGQLSNWIPVERSVRQGGVLSPWLYMAYIDDLPHQLRNSGCGAYVSNLFSGCPIQADDISLVSPTVNGLQTMINIVGQYANKWRYELNPAKSKIMIFGGTKRTKATRTKQPVWTLDGRLIEHSYEEKHVGIILNTYQCSKERTKQACRKGRNTFFSLQNVGLQQHGINPTIAAKLLHSIVYPRALFGAELWNDISTNETLILERLQTFCSKQLQCVGNRCRSDICTSLIGLCRIQAGIDIKKLMFLGRMARLPDDTLAKRMLKARALQFIVLKSTKSTSVTQRGYIPDIVQVLNKYNLESYWEKLITSDFEDFPAQHIWKRLVKKTVKDYEQGAWERRINADSDFDLFHKIHDKINEPAAVWKLARRHPNLLPSCKNMVQFIARTPKCDIDIQLCIYCGRFYTDIYQHVVLVCSKSSIERDLFWDKTVDIMSVEISAHLHNLEDDELYCAMLGGPLNLMTDETETDTFLQISGSFFTQILKYIY